MSRDYKQYKYKLWEILDQFPHTLDERKQVFASIGKAVGRASRTVYEWFNYRQGESRSIDTDALFIIAQYFSEYLDEHFTIDDLYNAPRQRARVTNAAVA